MKTIKVPQVKGPKAELCWKQPPLDSVDPTPMEHCDRRAKHSGRHSWETLHVEADNHHNALTCPYCNPKGLVLSAPVDPPSRFGTLTLGGEWADGARPFYFRATGDEGPVEPSGQVQGAEAAMALGEAFALFNARG